MNNTLTLQFDGRAWELEVPPDSKFFERVFDTWECTIWTTRSSGYTIRVTPDLRIEAIVAIASVAAAEWEYALDDSDDSAFQEHAKKQNRLWRKLAQAALR
jgi:hypothetical protein